MLDLISIRQQLEQELKNWDHVSAAVSIVKDGTVLLSEGFGWADAEAQRPADGDTLYQIASCTKAFTAAAAAVLVDRGQLDWDTPVSHYLPWLRFKDPYLTEHATLRDLLSHRTGLPRYDSHWMGNDCTRREMVENIRNMDSICGFRAGWNYHNYCYVAAGLVIEAVSGMSWEAFVRQELLDPIGMGRTYFYLDQMLADGNCAVPYGRPPEDPCKGRRKLDYFRTSSENWEAGVGAAFGPAGSMISCANDMAKWLQFHLNNGKVGDRQVISEKSMAEMHRVNMFMDGPMFCEFPETGFPSYGMAWFLESYRGRKLIWHGGNIDGFSLIAGFMPSEQVGVFIATNMEGSFLTNAVLYETMDRALDAASQPDWHQRWRGFLQEALQKRQESQPAVPVADTVPSHPLQDYAGRYTHPALGRLEIRVQDDQLELLFDCHGNYTSLRHYHYDAFQISEPTSPFHPMVIRFLTDASGRIDRVETPFGMDPRLPDMVFVRVPEKKEN